jgi:hypothetical protein
MNLRAMNMLYESIVKRGSLMVVPSGLADSLNLSRTMGLLGGAGMVPNRGYEGEGGLLPGDALRPLSAAAPTVSSVTSRKGD